ncbi:MAG: ABC transporter substrate-binding protein [Thermoanaerobacteraceae bacterium]|nr:ABC transporter substrate-binding protein [Thermoanaerobacteraceae bacterium]
MKKILIVLVILMSLFSVIGCSTSSNSSVKLKIALPTWTGYGPLYLAKEKGFFEEQGLDVELIKIEGLAERKQALAGKKIDGMATAQDVQVTLAAANVPVKVIWALDSSAGGDGILASEEIENVSDLKGKTVALEMGTTSHFFALTVLQDAGLSDDDIIIKNMTAGDAGAAFVAGKVDAAVTWEPWLSKGKDNGKVLVSTKDYPGIIVDSVSFRADIVEKYPQAMEGFVKAMAQAMEYWKNNKQEAEKIMAEGLGIDLEEFQATIPDLKFYDLEGNKKFFGTEEAPGAIYETTKKAINFYAKLNVIETEPRPEEIIDPGFINQI